MNIADIKFREIQVFLSLLKLKSVRELGRQYNIQPGQVSKIVSSLELKVGSKLFERSASGLSATARGLELLPYFEKMIELQESLQEARTIDQNEATFTFGSSSYFSTHLLPMIMDEMGKTELKKFKVRIIDLPPNQFIPSGLRGAFEYCLHTAVLDWPKTWTTEKVGVHSWHIFARKGHPAVKNPHLKEVKKHPFVTPIYWTSEGTRYGDDQCPIPERKKGHETATASSALEIIKVSDQLAFLPEILAKQSLERGEVEIVKVNSLPLVKRPVYLSVKNASVKQSTFDKILKASSDALRRGDE